LRKASPIASCTVAVTAVALHTLSPGRSAIIRKLRVRNRNAGATVVQIGTGLGGALVEAMPGFTVLAGLETEIPEEQLPEVEFFANITCQATVAGVAPADVQVQVEVEEYLGVTG
jgi:hypothetical protein